MAAGLWECYISMKEIKKIVFLVFTMIFLVGIISFSVNATLSQSSVCCEKTIDGAFCINTNSESCEAGFKNSPTSCESTSYCRLGTCYDSSEGICMENTPQRVCQESGGTWDERDSVEISQCQLGCCLISDQAAFVPLVRCKRLSSMFGIKMNYRHDIGSEVECIATAQGQDMGACVFEQDFARTCKFTTRVDCAARDVVENINDTNITTSNEKKFYSGFLCSAEELSTECARQVSTECYQGSVYWFDSCGNRENVYSSNKIKSWNNGKIANPDNICSPNDGSNKDCGNCDYLAGSRCAKEDGIFGIGEGHYCRRTDCDGHKNGESWCVYDGEVGGGIEGAGSRHFRQVCIDGEIHTEACADYRNKICIEGGVDSFSYSNCRVNKWQDCLVQDRKGDCENQDRRNCIWINSITGLNMSAIVQTTENSQVFSNPHAGQEVFSGEVQTENTSKNASAPFTGNVISGHAIKNDGKDDKDDNNFDEDDGLCIPDFTPGQRFWEAGDVQGICGQGNVQCVVKFEKKLIGSKKCVENCECMEDEWAMDVNRLCLGLGDCGAYINYQGTYTDEGYNWKIDNKRKKLSPNSVNKVKLTGNVIGVDAVQNIFGDKNE